MKKRVVGIFAAMLVLGMAAGLTLQAQDKPPSDGAQPAVTAKSAPAAADSQPASRPATKPAGAGSSFVIADCTVFKDNKLTVKFRMDENFDKYVSAQFAYPKAEAKGAEVGKVYVFTFKGGEAAHTSEGIKPIDEKNPPKDLNDHNLIGKVVGITEKAVLTEFVKEENLKRFYSREQTFTMWNPRTFSAGQVIKITFGDDNRHCRGYTVIEDNKNGK